jgi:hypothetical protein
MTHLEALTVPFFAARRVANCRANVRQNPLAHLTPERRKQIAAKALAARWKDHGPTRRQIIASGFKTLAPRSQRNRNGGRKPKNLKPSDLITA